MSVHKRINITIIVLSSVAIFLQTLILSISALSESKALQIVIAVLNAALVAIQSLQLNLKKNRTPSGAQTPIDDIPAVQTSGVKIPAVEDHE